MDTLNKSNTSKVAEPKTGVVTNASRRRSAPRIKIAKAAASTSTNPFLDELKKRSSDPITETIMQNIRDARSASNAE